MELVPSILLLLQVPPQSGALTTARPDHVEHAGLILDMEITDPGVLLAGAMKHERISRDIFERSLVKGFSSKRQKNIAPLFQLEYGL